MKHYKQRSIYRVAGSEEENFSKLRRRAFWVLPVPILLHAMCSLLVVPSLCKVQGVLAVVACVGGFALRRRCYAQPVLAVNATLFVLGYSHGLGVMAPASAMILLKLDPWVPWIISISWSIQGAVLWVLTRDVLAKEWAIPLDSIPEISIDRISNTIVWVDRAWDSRLVSFFSVVWLLVVVPAVNFSEGKTRLLASLVIGPAGIALLLAPVFARMIALFVAVRRWEYKHGMRLRLPSLPP